MTELSFLIELLLNHELPKETKALIASRIKDVEANLVGKPVMQVTWPPMQPAGQPLQAASTLAAMAKHNGLATAPAPVMPPIEPVAVIAQTPAAAAAMNSRNEAINQALSGKVDKVSGRPRKW